MPSLFLFTAVSFFLLQSPAWALSSAEKKVLGFIDLSRVQSRIASCADAQRSSAFFGAGSVLAGSEADRNLTAWIVSTFKSIGMPEVSLQKIPALLREVQSFSLTVDGAKMDAVPFWGTQGDKVNGPLLDVGHGTTSEYPVESAGKIFLVERDDFITGSLDALIHEALPHHPKAILVFGVRGGKEPLEAIRQSVLNTSLPVISISPQTGRELREKIKRRNPSEASVVFEQTKVKAETQNIMARWKGAGEASSRQKPIVFSATSERFFSGALESCGGIAALMELAELLKTGSFMSGRPVELVVWGAQETDSEASQQMQKDFFSAEEVLHHFVLQGMGEPGADLSATENIWAQELIRKVLSETSSRAAHFELPTELPDWTLVWSYWQDVPTTLLRRSPEDEKRRTSLDRIERWNKKNFEKDLTAVVVAAIRLDTLGGAASIGQSELIASLKAGLARLKGLVDKERIKRITELIDKSLATKTPRAIGGAELKKLSDTLVDVSNDGAALIAQPSMSLFGTDLPLMTSFYNQVQRSRWNEAEKTMKKLTSYGFAKNLSLDVFQNLRKQLDRTGQSRFGERYVMPIDPQVWVLFMGGRKNIAALLKLVESETDRMELELGKRLGIWEASLKKIQSGTQAPSGN